MTLKESGGLLSQNFGRRRNDGGLLRADCKHPKKGSYEGKQKSVSASREIERERREKVEEEAGRECERWRDATYTRCGAAAVVGGKMKSTPHNIRIEPSSGNVLGPGALDESGKSTGKGRLSCYVKVEFARRCLQHGRHVFSKFLEVAATGRAARQARRVSCLSAEAPGKWTHLALGERHKKDCASGAEDRKDSIRSAVADWPG